MRPNYTKQSPKGPDIKLPIEFFADKKNKYLRPELLSNDAKKLADAFMSRGKMTIHQLRKFYHQLLSIKQRIEIKQVTKDSKNKNEEFKYQLPYIKMLKPKDQKEQEEEFKRQLPYIKMLKAYAHYAKSRKNVTDNFCNFMEKQIDTIKDISDFNAFCDLFEAIVAFATVYDKQYKKNR